MGIYSIVVLSIVFISILTGIIFGLMRGAKRSILRLILIIIALAIMIIINGSLVDKINLINVGDKPLPEMIMSALPEDFTKYEDILMPMVMTFACVFTFIIGFLSLQIITLILYWILKLFVKPKVTSSGVVRKNAFVGMFIGLIQGLLVALAYGAMLSALGNNIVKITKIEMNDETVLDLDELDNTGKIKIGVGEYCDSSLSKLFTKVGKFIYKPATTVKIDGEKYTFDGQFDALSKAIAMLNEISTLAEVDFSQGITADNKDDIVEMLNNLDNLTDDMSDEVAKTLNELFQTVGSDITDVDTSDLDLREVEFSKVANVVENIDEVKENPTQDNIDQIVNDLIDSNIIFVLADSTDISFDEFDEDTKNMITNSINEKNDLTAEEKAKLKDLFGIN